MIRNFLRIATRIFLRDQTYSIITISGLVVGLTTSIFIFLWVMDEMRYDQFHTDGDRIFQVMENVVYPDTEILTYDATPAPLAEKLQNEFPDVEQTCRTSWQQRIQFSLGKENFFQEGFYADPDFFRVFTFPLAEGNPTLLLPNPNSVVISKKMAEKYFHEQPALGKMLQLDNGVEVTITGVLETVPNNSTLKFDFILPFTRYAKVSYTPLSWNQHNIITYLKIKSSSSAKELESKIKNLLITAKAENEVVYLFLYSLNDWRLRSHFENGVLQGGRIFYVISFSFVALFILIVACINFMNLATARAGRRSREVGIRKVAGASRSSLIQQFMIESLLLSFLSLFIALFCVYLFLPLFNNITNKNLHLDFQDLQLDLGLLGITIICGILAGSYPAFFLSSFRPASVLKSNLISVWKGVGLRKILVLSQFGLSVVLIVSAIVINTQVQFMRTKDLGYDKNNVLHFRPQRGSLKEFESFEAEALKNPAIESIGRSQGHPMNLFNNDYVTWSELPPGQKATVQTEECDYNYLQTLGFKLIQGRFFSKELASDSSGFIINESCAKMMGFKNPIGHEITVYKFKGPILGIVNDFHNRNLYSKIDPVIFLMNKSDDPMSIYVRYAKGELLHAVDHIRKTYKKFESTFPLEISFLDKDLDAMYRSEILTGQLSVCFMIIAIFISCLGLFGLTLFTTERRTKEIGVRKVLGASVQSLVMLLCNDFIRPVLFSLVFGLPIGYYLMINFLNKFQFHTELNLWLFLFTAACLIILALITVTYQSTKAALTNPADTLRTE